jgi:hypothetical protein
LAARVSCRKVRVEASWEDVMSSTRSSSPGRSCLALATLAILAGGCVSTDRATYIAQGTGLGTPRSFEVGGGAHAIAWRAVDKAPPTDGCLFGLIIDPVDLAPTEDGSPAAGYSLPKLAYEVLRAGGSLDGHATLDLRAGTYQFVVEGSCAWNVIVDGRES